MKEKKLGMIRCICRIVVGLVFIFSGFVKAVDPLGTNYKIQDYLVAFGPFFEHFIAISLFLSFVQLTFEFILGFNLLFNIHLKISSFLVLLFMAFMTPLTLYIAIANPVSDCGCFGDALVISNWETFFKNVILLGLTITLICSLKKYHRQFKHTQEWIIMAIGTLAIAALSFYCYNHLPIIDFRPYKIGTDIQKNMVIPDNAELDEYETFFIYEKDGEEKEFTIENYPKEDSGWNFVEQKTTLVKKGYTPPIHDFNIMNAEGDDITYDILDDEGYTFLLIAYDTKKSETKYADKINKVYTFAVENGQRFVALTSSVNSDIELYKQQTGAQYEWCKTDPITLKTIIRANPGLVLIKNGRIVGKWNSRDIPSDLKETESKIEQTYNH